jgi:DNA adenine methylase
MVTPLRYPGGKSRAVKVILPLIPEDCGELCSPFLGGGSIEIAAAERGMTVHGYDLFAPLVWFWEEILTRPDKVSRRARTYSENVANYTPLEYWVERWNHFAATAPVCKKNCRVHNKESTTWCNDHAKLEQLIQGNLIGISEDTFRKCQTHLKSIMNTKGKATIDKAAQLFVVNKSGRSGATLSGGYSWRASWDRYNELQLQKLSEFELANFNVGCADFDISIRNHPASFLYLDPPYYLEEKKNKLYGTNGSLHEGFDHVRLYQTLKSVDNPFIMSYNQSSFIRTLYEEIGATCINLEDAWAYGMNTSKKSDEMIVTNLPHAQIRAQIEKILNKEKGEQDAEKGKTNESGSCIHAGTHDSSKQESRPQCRP